jgi:hypothetical protein
MAVVSWGGALGHRWRWVDGVGSGLGEGESSTGKAYRLGLNILGLRPLALTCHLGAVGG